MNQSSQFFRLFVSHKLNQEEVYDFFEKNVTSKLNEKYYSKKDF